MAETKKRGADRLKKRAERKPAAPDPIREELEALAFGRVNDVVKLVVYGKELTGDELERLDLSALSELKAGEKGLEVKLCDRLKAIEMLQAYLHAEESGQNGVNFFEALEQSAALIQKASKETDPADEL